MTDANTSCSCCIFYINLFTYLLRRKPAYGEEKEEAGM